MRLANDSDFGLCGSVFGADTERAYEVARRIQTGNISVNGLATGSRWRRTSRSAATSNRVSGGRAAPKGSKHSWKPRRSIGSVLAERGDAALMNDLYDFIMVGGGSSVNVMAYTRGSRRDYELWNEACVGAGWSWDDLDPTSGAKKGTSGSTTRRTAATGR